MGKFTDIRISLGISFLIIGVVLANLLRPIIHVDMVDFVMISVPVMIFDYKGLGKWPSLSNAMKLLVLSQIIAYVYVLGGDYKNEKLETLCVYSIVVCVCFASLRKVKLRYFPFLFYLLSTLSSLIALFLLTSGFSGIVEVGDMRDVTSEYEQNGQSMVFIYPTAAILHVMASFLLVDYIPHKWHRILYVALVVDFIVILIAGKRTPIITYFVCIAFFCWNKGLKLNWGLIVKILMVIFAISAVASHIPILSYYWAQMSERTLNGVSTLLGLEKMDVDESAVIRVGLRAEILRIFDSYWNIGNYFWGYGVYKYLDQPFIEALFDMGICGIFVYVNHVIILPLKYIREKSQDPMIVFAIMLCIPNIISSFSAGMPYGYSLYYQVALLIYVVGCTRANFTNNCI